MFAEVEDVTIDQMTVATALPADAIFGEAIVGAREPVCSSNGENNDFLPGLGFLSIVLTHYAIIKCLALYNLQLMFMCAHPTSLLIYT